MNTGRPKWILGGICLVIGISSIIFRPLPDLTSHDYSVAAVLGYYSGYYLISVLSTSVGFTLLIRYIISSKIA